MVSLASGLCDIVVICIAAGLALSLSHFISVMDDGRLLYGRS